MDNSVKITLIIVSAVLILAVGGFVYLDNLSGRDTISVAGESTVKAMPDLLTVYFVVQTTANTATEAKDNNSMIVDQVITNLIAAGLERDEIVTENFNVYEDYSWESGKRKFLGYKAVHNMKVELSSENSEKIGEVIDAVVDGGALLNYINFELSKENQNLYKAEALKSASEDARIKAESMAEGLGKRVVDIVSVSESSFGYYPWRLLGQEDIALGAAEAKAATTDIQPGEKEISARVSVVFKIK